MPRAANHGQTDDAGCEKCVGAGQLEGWFKNTSWESERRGWGHLESTYFQGTLFFHLQRSPSMRGVEWSRNDVVFFEVVEINGRYEAVKMLLPSMLAKMGHDSCDDLQAFVGQRVEGTLRSPWQVVQEKKWGFVSCPDLFEGNVFWHLEENPKMKDQKFYRGDVVSFEIFEDTSRGERNDKARAKDMEFIRHMEREEQQKAMKTHLSPSKLLKKRKWMENWRSGPPPDWNCKGCGYHNFGRNKVCKTCDTKRPPREEWPEEEEEELQKSVAPNIPLLPAAFQANLPVQFQTFAQKPLEVRRNFVDASANPEETGKDEDWSQKGWWENQADNNQLQDQVLMPSHMEQDQGQSLGLSRLPDVASSFAWAPPDAGSPKNTSGCEQQITTESTATATADLAWQLWEPTLAPPMTTPTPQVTDSEAPTLSSMPAAFTNSWAMTATATAVASSLDVAQSSQAVNPNPSARPATATTPATMAAATATASFDDLLSTNCSEEELVQKIKDYLAEVNQTLGIDRAKKQSFAADLAKHPWFPHSGYEVRYRPAANSVEIALTPAARAQRRQR